jgi:hypothetical protein
MIPSSLAAAGLDRYTASNSFQKVDCSTEFRVQKFNGKGAIAQEMNTTLAKG